MWRGHHSRSRFGRHVDIIRRYEQLKGAAAEGADTQPEERDLAEEVRSELAFIGEQLREQLANSKASQPPVRAPSPAPSQSDSATLSLAKSPVLMPSAVAELGAELEPDSPGFLPRPEDGSLSLARPAPSTDAVTSAAGELSVTIREEGKLGINFGVPLLASSRVCSSLLTRSCRRQVRTARPGRW